MSSITENKLELKQIKKMKKAELVDYILSLYVDIDLENEINKSLREIINMKQKEEIEKMEKLYVKGFSKWSDLNDENKELKKEIDKLTYKITQMEWKINYYKETYNDHV
tara:strand:- start:618 stop:944 length:327 start_codon:yes stop_codon:yes gene_type:complete